MENVNAVIVKALTKMDVSDQRKVDRKLLDLDGTTNKSTLGANAVLGVSMAVAVARASAEHRSLFRSLAEQYEIPQPTLLPVPLVNVINGGMHADSGLSFQEFMLVPTGFDRFSEALRAAAEIFALLKANLRKAGHVVAVGDEGGFAPHLQTARDALQMLVQTIREAGYEGRVQLALDCAASAFCEKGIYTVDGRKLGASQLLGVYEELSTVFPIVSIEDPFAEDDWSGFAQAMKEMGDRVQIVGDDLFVTNVARIEEGITRSAANAVLIKLNQIGTVSETVDAMQKTQAAGWNAVVSHRSGETEDTFIADLAVALRCGQIKTGSMSRSERLAKYNQLLRIEEELGEKAEYRNPFG